MDFKGFAFKNILFQKLIFFTQCVYTICLLKCMRFQSNLISVKTKFVSFSIEKRSPTCKNLWT